MDNKTNVEPYVVRVLADDPAGPSKRKLWLAYSDMTYEIIYIEVPAYRTDDVEYYDLPWNKGLKRMHTTGFRKGMELSHMAKAKMTKPEAHAFIKFQSEKWIQSCKESKEKFGKYG